MTNGKNPHVGKLQIK